jgi:hypothetical protein
MDADTYPNEEVAGFLNRSEMVVPLQMLFDQEPWAGRFQVRWTPRLLVLDGEERVQQQALGFQSPGQLVPWLTLGAAKSFFSAAVYGAAEGILQRVIDGYPGSMAAPEAVYLRAVARFRQDHDSAHLKSAHLTMVKDYADSIWVERTSPYNKL